MEEDKEKKRECKKMPHWMKGLEGTTNDWVGDLEKRMKKAHKEGKCNKDCPYCRERCEQCRKNTS